MLVLRFRQTVSGELGGPRRGGRSDSNAGPALTGGLESGVLVGRRLLDWGDEMLGKYGARAPAVGGVVPALTTWCRRRGACLVMLCSWLGGCFGQI
jgi:hypothetical protein